MSKRQKHLRNPRIGDTIIFVRYLVEVLRAYRDDPCYVPSKSSLQQFRQITRTLNSATNFAAEIEQRMEGRREGYARPKQDDEANPSH